MSWFKKGLKAVSPLAMALNKDNAIKIASGGIGAGYSDPKQMAGGAAAGVMNPRQLAGGVGTAMQEPFAEYQAPAAGMNKMAYNPEAAAKFQAAMQANRAQRPQMGQQMSSSAQQLIAAGSGSAMPEFFRNQGMKNPPFYNPPPGQNMQMQGSMGQNMIDNNASQGSFQEFLAGRGQGSVPPEAFQNYAQQQAQQPQPQAQRSGVNAGRVRQSAGIYKDPNTGALYGNDGKLMRAGTRRMR